MSELPSPEEIAYAAGLFEGEGSILHVSIEVTKKPYGRAAMTINMTDREPLERIHAILGGTLRGPYDRSKHGSRKPMWVWRMARWEDIEHAYELLRP